MRTEYGFRWDQVVVERCMSFMARSRDTQSTKVITVGSDYHTLQISVSPTGRSVRVWRDGKELK